LERGFSFELEFVDFDVAYSDLLVRIIYERFVETALEVVLYPAIKLINSDCPDSIRLIKY